MKSYNYGLRTEIDVVAAQRVLANARAEEVNARTQLLTAWAALGYQTGELLHSIPPPLTGLITLAQNLASIVAPLYVDIRATFTNLSTP